MPFKFMGFNNKFKLTGALFRQIRDDVMTREKVTYSFPSQRSVYQNVNFVWLLAVNTTILSTCMHDDKQVTDPYIWVKLSKG